MFPAPVQEAGLPDSPSRVTLAQLAERTAGNARGAVLETKTAIDGVAYPTRVKVWYSPYGTLAHDEIVDFSWDPNDPPLQLGSAADRERDSNPLCLFAKDKRLLCVSYEHDQHHAWLISTVSMARLPSTRFSARELELAWLAKQIDRGGRWMVNFDDELDRLSMFSSGPGYVDFAPGHLELAFRFAPSRIAYLRSFSERERLAPADAEHIRWCTWDPCAEHDALHALLDNGLKVDSSPFVAETTRFCARVAQGDEAARKSVLVELARLEKLLSWKSTEPHTGEDVHEHTALQNALGNSQMQSALIETAAYGSKEALPMLRVTVQRRLEHSAFAWLRLGGAIDELIALTNGNVLMLPLSDLARAGTLDALKLLLMRLGARAKQVPEQSLQEDLEFIDRLVGALEREAAGPALELMRGELRKLLESDIEQAGNRCAMLLALVHAGDDAAVGELLARLEGLPSHSIGFALELAEVPGPRAVPLLTRLVLTALDGYEFDDIGQASHNVSMLAGALHRRSAADRALALELFDAAQRERDRQASTITLVRWALGELPTVAQLRDLEMSDVIQSCELSLESDRARYAELLPELRSDPRKYWLQLALLRDETSLPELGEWLQKSIEAGVPYFEPLCAMRLMASPNAAPYFTGLRHGSLPGLAEDYYSVLGSIESPANLPSVARRGLAAKDPTEQLAWLEFLILLGRRD